MSGHGQYDVKAQADEMLQALDYAPTFSPDLTSDFKSQEEVAQDFLRRAYAAGRDAGIEAAMGVTLDRMRLHGNNRDELVKRGGSLLQAAAEHASAEACYACQERMFALKTGGE
jgi:hypothetical protein